MLPTESSQLLEPACSLSCQLRLGSSFQFLVKLKDVIRTQPSIWQQQWFDCSHHATDPKASQHRGNSRAEGPTKHKIRVGANSGDAALSRVRYWQRCMRSRFITPKSPSQAAGLRPAGQLDQLVPVLRAVALALGHRHSFDPGWVLVEVSAELGENPFSIGEAL